MTFVPEVAETAAEFDLVTLLQHPLSLLGVIVILVLKLYKQQQILNAKQRASESENTTDLLKAMIHKDTQYDKSSVMNWNKRLEEDIDELRSRVSQVESRLSRIEASVEIIRKKVLNGNH